MKARLRYLKLVIGAMFCLALAHGSQPSSTLAQSEISKTSGVAFISPEELKAKIAGTEPLLIIDVRSSETYAHSDQKIRGAVHVKLRRLEHRLSFAPFKDVPRDRQAVTYCACPADEASIAAARVLLENGFKSVRALKGGWREWLKVSGQTDRKPRL